jgi:hypothetical protein
MGMVFSAQPPVNDSSLPRNLCNIDIVLDFSYEFSSLDPLTTPIIIPKDTRYSVQFSKYYVFIRFSSVD